MNNLTIVHANELVEASYSLSMDELRVIALASTKVDSRKKSIGEIRIDVSDFKKAYGVNHGHVYSDLRNAVKSIMRKPIRFFDGNVVRELAWLSSNEYRTDNGSYVVIEFSPKIEPYLFELKERFTAVNFEYASKLNTPFSFRLYQWLYRDKNFKRSKHGETISVEFEVDWMKSKSGLSANSYERWDVFSDKVIKPAIDKINANTDLSVIWRPIKTGRKVTAVKFNYVIEVGTTEKPIRPRLHRRPRVMKGSHDEGIWMRKNLMLLLNFEAKLKNYDSNMKLSLPDLRKMFEYAIIAEPELQQRLKEEIKIRTKKKTI